MRKYSKELVEKIRLLRSYGNTYSEIGRDIAIKIPKSTFSDLCKGVALPKEYAEKISKLNVNSLNKGRLIAVEYNKLRRKKLFEELDRINLPIAKNIVDKRFAKIALAMLCLGEASKYNPKNRTAFYLGNSDPKIMVIFLVLLKRCFNFNLEKARCVVQCRADQDPEDLKHYWSKITGIPERLFYKANVDPRTKGKPTIKKDYKGVLRIEYFDSKVQHELESLSKMIYNELSDGPEV